MTPLDANPRETVPTGKLWFGVGAAPVAWFGVGLADMFITWRACLHQESSGGPSEHPAAQMLYFVSTFVLLAVAAIAGTWSYRKWTKLCGVMTLLRAEGREREEFMALAGLFISFTLGVGIVWLCLPLFVIRMCLRIR